MSVCFYNHALTYPDNEGINVQMLMTFNTSTKNTPLLISDNAPSRTNSNSYVNFTDSDIRNYKECTVKIISGLEYLKSGKKITDLFLYRANNRTGTLYNNTAGRYTFATNWLNNNQNTVESNKLYFDETATCKLPTGLDDWQQVFIIVDNSFLKNNFDKNAKPVTEIITPSISANNATVTITKDNTPVTSFNSGDTISIDIKAADNYQLSALTIEYFNETGEKQTYTDFNNLPVTITCFNQLNIVATATQIIASYKFTYKAVNCTVKTTINGIEKDTYNLGDIVTAEIIADFNNFTYDNTSAYVDCTEYGLSEVRYFNKTTNKCTFTANNTTVTIYAKVFLLVKNDFIRNYIVTNKDMTALAQCRFSYLSQTSSGENGFLSDLASYAINFKRFYCSIPYIGSELLKIGYYQVSGAECKVCDELQFALEDFIIEIPKIYNNRLDFDSTIKIFLPFIGLQNLDTKLYMNERIIVRYRVDIISGECIASLINSRNIVLDTFTGKIAIEIPFNVDKTYLNISTNNNSLLQGDIIATTFNNNLLNKSYTSNINKFCTIGDLTGFNRFDFPIMDNLEIQSEIKDLIKQKLQEGIIL